MPGGNWREVREGAASEGPLKAAEKYDLFNSVGQGVTPTLECWVIPRRWRLSVECTDSDLADGTPVLALGFHALSHSTLRILSWLSRCSFCKWRE